MEAAMSACPLCSECVEPRYMERHVRMEMSYSPWRCKGCRMEFFSFEDTQAHFSPRFGRHEGQDVFLAELFDFALEDKIAGFLGLPKLGPLDGPKAHTLPQADEHSYEEEATEEMDADQPDPQPTPSPPPLCLVKTEVGEESVAGDSAVPCAVCGLRVIKSRFRAHAQALHMKTPPFQCRLCPLKSNRKPVVLSHIRKAHDAGEEEMLDTSAHLGDLLRRTQARCFGDVAASTTNPKKVCRGCEAPVAAASILNHVARHHLNGAVFSCRHCDYEGQCWDPSTMERHVKRKHGGQPDGYSSRRAELRPVLTQLVAEYFD